MGEYSARQQLKLSAIEDDVKANQQVTADHGHTAIEAHTPTPQFFFRSQNVGCQI